MKTGNTVVPLGIPSLVNAVDPPDARRRLFPDVIAEKEVNETPLPQEKVPPETPQFPLEEVMVKLELVPEMVYVARVCVDQVPSERSPPTSEPGDCRALIVALVGKLGGVPVGVEVGVVVPVVVVDVVGGGVVVPVGVPDFKGYVIPLDGHDPALGAEIGMNAPSMIEPFRLKYQEMALREPDWQLSAGVNPPEADWSADVSAERVYVWVDDGVIPALASQVYVGRLWKSLTTVWKNATASAPCALPLGRQLVLSVLIHVPCVDHSCSQNISFWPLMSTQNCCM